MEEIKSGKELCDIFFDSLSKREDIDRQIADLLRELYINENFTREAILQGLKTSKGDTQDE